MGHGMERGSSRLPGSAGENEVPGQEGQEMGPGIPGGFGNYVREFGLDPLDYGLQGFRGKSDVIIFTF